MKRELKTCRKGLHQYEGRRCTDCAKARKSVYMSEYYQKNKVEILAYDSAYQKANAERVNARKRAWKLANPEKVAGWKKPDIAEKRERNEKWAKANPDKVKAGIKAWQDKNKDRSLRNARAWVKRNPDKANAKTAKRQAAKIAAVPAWANDFFVKEIYHLARLRTKATGFKWHVDHIVPLRSKLVCGLHWEYNLQVIPETENRAKGNRHWPDMP